MSEWVDPFAGAAPRVAPPPALRARIEELYAATGDGDRPRVGDQVRELLEVAAWVQAIERIERELQQARGARAPDRFDELARRLVALMMLRDDHIGAAANDVGAELDDIALASGLPRERLLTIIEADRAR